MIKSYENMSPDEANLKIAEYIGDAGFNPAETCLSGCCNIDQDGGFDGYNSQIGALCIRHFPTRGEDPLREEWVKNITNKSWHPEWRIGRGKPKNFCDSMDLLLPVVEKFIKDNFGEDAGYSLSWKHGNIIYETSVWAGEQSFADLTIHLTPSQALAFSLCEAIDYVRNNPSKSFGKSKENEIG